MPSPRSGISRRDYAKSHGYWVRYQREGVRFQKSFADGSYVTREEALGAAEAYYEELKAAFPPMGRREYSEVKRRVGSSGLVGVNRTNNIVKGHTYYYWQARWSHSPGVQKWKRFSINRYGEEEAKRRAIAAREAGLREMEQNWPEGFAQLRTGSSWQRDGSDASRKLPYIELYAFEGASSFRLHRERERDRSLREAKLELFYSQHRDLFCELCGFSFEREYGTLGRGLIEVHHVTPLSKLASGQATHLDDLMLVCANCHLAIHASDPVSALDMLQRLFSSRTDLRKHRTKRPNQTMQPTAGRRTTSL